MSHMSPFKHSQFELNSCYRWMPALHSFENMRFLMSAQSPTDFKLTQATFDQGDMLADLRSEAMRPSLEAVGRFEPDTARARVLGTFSPEETMCVEVDGALAGFITLRMKPDHYYLDHLYIAPAFQNQGLGGALIKRMQASAVQASLPILCIALIESASNRFYERHGFQCTQRQDFDNYYIWLPEGFSLNTQPDA
jgi:ribosomal protein S18 acetylase RimI-like enzyme